MKKIPKILIIGRPNVGKSTLINKLTKQKKAITFDTPGVTRDLVDYPCTYKTHHFMIVDSGGVLFEKNDDIHMQERIETLVLHALESADHLIFMTDGNDGLHPLDKTIANIIRPYKGKVSLAVNKLDNPNRYSESQLFHSLGLGDPIAISVLQGRGIDHLISNALESLPKGKDITTLFKQAFNISFIGRPNVGKSSLLNAIINEDRIIVDDTAGTTRDAIDVYFNHGETQYVITDTAGLRRRAKVHENIEFYSTVRSRKAISQSDLVLVILDAKHFLSEQDKKIINEVISAKRNMIIFVNKWDLCNRTDTERRDLERIAINELPFLVNYPFIFGSAKEKVNLGKMFSLIPSIIDTSRLRIPTGQLNQTLKNIFEKTPPPSKKGKRLKIYYVTQAEKSPPTFILFVNEPKLIDDDYKRYLEKRVRTLIHPFKGVPIQIYLKGKQKNE